MKKIQTFLEKNPGYTRASVSSIVKYSKAAETTVRKFKKTEMFKTIKQNHLAKVKANQEQTPSQA